MLLGLATDTTVHRGKRLKSFTIRASDSAWHHGLPGRPMMSRSRFVVQIRQLKSIEQLPDRMSRASYICGGVHWKVDVRLPGKENSNSHGARPVHQIIPMTSQLSLRSLPVGGVTVEGTTRHGFSAPCISQRTEGETTTRVVGWRQTGPLSLRLKHLLGPVTRVKKKKRRNLATVSLV